MTVPVEFSPPARRALSRLPLDVAAAVIALVDGDLADNPHRVGKPLGPPFEGEHSARRGPYRVRYRIGAEAITILAVSHRRDAYRT